MLFLLLEVGWAYIRGEGGGGGSFFDSYGIMLVFENAIKTNLGVM